VLIRCLAFGVLSSIAVGLVIGTAGFALDMSPHEVTVIATPAGMFAGYAGTIAPLLRRRIQAARD
jgi:hypothetical protein